MKKIIPVYIFILLFSSAAHSQYLKHEISFSFGIAPVQVLTEPFGSAFISPMNSSIDSSSVNASDLINIRYKNYLSKNVSLGIAFSYSRINSLTIYSRLGDVTTFSKSKYYTILANASYYYIPKNIIQLYSGISIGVSVAKRVFSYSNTTASSIENLKTIAYQLNPLGIRVGERVGGFIEFGFGYEGVINGGFSVKF